MFIYIFKLLTPSINCPTIIGIPCTYILSYTLNLFNNPLSSLYLCYSPSLSLLSLPITLSAAVSPVLRIVVYCTVNCWITFLQCTRSSALLNDSEWQVCWVWSCRFITACRESLVFIFDSFKTDAFVCTAKHSSPASHFEGVHFIPFCDPTSITLKLKKKLLLSYLNHLRSWNSTELFTLRLRC